MLGWSCLLLKSHSFLRSDRRTSMQYRELGRTGIKVSEIGIGGEGFENKSYSDCKNMIECAMKSGNRYAKSMCEYLVI